MHRQTPSQGSQTNSYTEALRRLAWPKQYIPPIPGNGLKEHGTQVMQIAFSPDDRFFASFDRGGLLLIWNTANWKVIKRLPNIVEEPGYNSSLALSVGGKYVATRGKVYSVQTGDKVAELPGIIDQTFSPDGKYLVGGESLLAFYEMGSWKQVWQDDPKRMERSILGVPKIIRYQFSRDGKILLTERYGSVIHAMDTTTYKTVFYKLGDKIGDGASNPGILTLPKPHPPTMGDYLLAYRTDWRGGYIVFYDMKTNERVFQWPYHTGSSVLPQFQHRGIAFALLQSSSGLVGAQVWAAGGREEMRAVKRYLSTVARPSILSHSGYVLAWGNDYDINFALLAKPSELPMIRRA